MVSLSIEHYCSIPAASCSIVCLGISLMDTIEDGKKIYWLFHPVEIRSLIVKAGRKT